MVAQIVEKYSAFMKSEGSLPCSQEVVLNSSVDLLYCTVLYYSPAGIPPYFEEEVCEPQ
jgi:hypothetical protein